MKPPPWGRLVAAIRPHDRVVRDRVFRLLEELGLRVETLVAEGVSDAKAVSTVRNSRARVLLVPFHGHADETGLDVDGLRFLESLANAHGQFGWRVLMPVSAFGVANLTLRQKQLRSAEVGRSILLLPIERLGDSDILESVRVHLGLPTNH